MYEVNCGRDGQRKIINCDRLQRKIVQNQMEESEVEASVDNELDEVVNDLESEILEEVDDLVRNPDVWVGKRPVKVAQLSNYDFLVNFVLLQFLKDHIYINVFKKSSCIIKE